MLFILRKGICVLGYAFISYNSANKKVATRLKKLLNGSGVETWIAPDDIPVGKKYAKVLNSALKNSACLVLLLSDAAQSSNWVAREVERAINYNKPIVTIRLEDLVLNDEFEFYLSVAQMVDIRDFDESNPEVQAVIEIIKEYTGTTVISDMVVTQDTVEEKKNIKPAYIAAIAGVCVLALLLALLLGGKAKKAETPKTATTTTETAVETTLQTTVQTTLAQNTTQTTKATQAPKTTQKAKTTGATKATAAPPVGENQIPSQYAQMVTSMKHSAMVDMYTVKVVVGGYGTPWGAIAWSNATIYSENTAIAIGEGTLVKGIAKGETYIILATPQGSAQAYRVIVE